MPGLNGGDSPNLLYSSTQGVHCNTHDDLAHQQIYGKACLGGEILSLDADYNNVAVLTPPSGALKALIVLEPAPGADPNAILARFKTCGDTPSLNEGFPLFRYACFEVGSVATLSNFKICSVDGLQHVVRVMYANNSVSVNNIGFSSSSSNGLTDAELRAAPIEFKALFGETNGGISTQNLNLNGAATANSALELDCSGLTTLLFHVTGAYGGTLVVQVSLDGGNWVTLGANALYNIATQVYSGSITGGATGAYKCDITGAKKVRVTATTAVTGGGPVIKMNVSAENAPNGLNQPIPGGGNSIGIVSLSHNGGIGAGPATHHKRNSTADTNLVSVKNGNGVVASVEVVNDSASTVYLKLYNKASAPVINTDVALIVKVIRVPAGSFISVPVPAVGWRFTTGIAYCIVRGLQDTDATATEAGTIIAQITYT